MTNHKSQWTLALAFASIFFWSQKSHSVEGLDFGIKIPVRLGVFAGAQSGTSSYAADKTSIPVTSYNVGIDFNVPIAPIHTLIGIQGWYMGQGKSGNAMKSSFFLIGVYGGYTGKADDIFLGVGATALSTKLSDDEVTAPTTETSLYKSVPCGFLGWRHYFKAKVTTGIGLTGYYCQGSEYEKTVTTTTDLKSTVSDKVTASGGSLYFIVTWGEERKLM